MWQLACDVYQLVCRWWQSDRPRVSPREGRLLRIKPAAILWVGSHITEVQRRTVGEDAEGPYVVYHCLCGDQVSQLRITPLGYLGKCETFWSRGDIVCEVAEDDIEVFQPPERASSRGSFG